MIPHYAGAPSRHLNDPHQTPSHRPAADRLGKVLSLLPAAELRRLVAAMVD